MKIETNIVSSLEKCRRDASPSDIKRLEKIYAFRGEHINFQFVFRPSDFGLWDRRMSVFTECETAEVRIREVKDVCADFDTYAEDPSRGTAKMLSYAGKSYPDVLEPISENDILRPQCDELTEIWCDLRIPSDATDFSVCVGVKNSEKILAKEEIRIEVIAVTLDEADYKCTNWFHVDCLATYYDVPIFSERHWEIIDAYMKCAAENGINMILTPIFTPPIDTAVGGERPTVQLVGVKKDADGRYSFDFSLLARYIDLCRKNGIKWIEISHLFTQWGAKYAPKIVADVSENGGIVKKRIFGWDTDGLTGEYPIFLSAFLPELVAFLKEKGVYERCIFHISDEPTAENMQGYIKAKKLVDPYLSDAYIADACADTSIVATGALRYPIPCNDKMSDFLALDLPERWTYYCCTQYSEVANRFICYPSWRNRILGTQMYKYNIRGFLQWAFNFWYSEHSLREINPYTDMSGGGWVPAGDTFVVYPGLHGVPYESLRLAVFAEGLSDLRALKTCERICGREAVMKLVEHEGEITFEKYPEKTDYILSLRRGIAELIKNKL